MPYKFINQQKYCEWCGGHFMKVRGHQSDMCAICFTRLKEYQKAQRHVNAATRQLEELVAYYREQAKQGYRTPEGM